MLIKIFKPTESFESFMNIDIHNEKDIKKSISNMEEESLFRLFVDFTINQKLTLNSESISKIYHDKKIASPKIFDVMIVNDINGFTIDKKFNIAKLNNINSFIQ